MASTSGTSCPEQTGLGLAALTAHLNKKSFVDKLSTLEDAEEYLRKCYPSLLVQRAEVNGSAGIKSWVIVCTPLYFLTKEAGPVQPARMVLNGDGTYSFQVFLCTIHSGIWKDTIDYAEINELLDTLLPRSGYIVCPGIQDYEANMEPFVSFQSKHLRVWNHPLKRYDCTTCLLWYKHVQARKDDSDMCRNCKHLNHDLQVIKNRACAASPGHKKKWTEPSSNRPIKFLSPDSKAARIVKSSKARKRLRRALSNFEDADVNLDNDQNNEMTQLVNEIENKGRNDLERIFEEAEESNKGNKDIVQQVWERDIEERKSFYEDQLKNRTSSRGNRWSIVTLRIALAVYTRSPTAYDALKGFGILQLPSVSTLKSYTSFNTESGGVSEERLGFARKQYDALVAQKCESGGKVPFNEGILIFDEVKVGLKLHYHAKSGKLLGLAMSADELCSLHDVFQTIQIDHRSQKASYVLQYLWRCTASNFDIIGPYYTSAKQVSNKFIIATLYETIHALHLYGFNTKAIVCDGASSNMATIKQLTGFGSGAYGVQDENAPIMCDVDIASTPRGTNTHEVKAWFLNPHTNEKVYTLICPSHQLKNMVAALYSSKRGRTKLFKYEGVEFGWDAIELMFTREVGRINDGIPRRVPGLRQNYVYRDIWTRLNVKPAKIMQQQYVLAELSEYLDSQPSDAPSIKLAVKYLQMLNNFFEEGILSHSKITKFDGSVLQKMEAAMNWYTIWLDSLREEGLVQSNPSQKSFLSWQTWDLMRICWYGFKGYCQEFLTSHPGYFVTPLRLNGSAIETIFSQLKHASRGSLTAVTYESARAQLLTRRSIHGPHTRDEYRDAPVYLKDSELPQKKKPRKQK